MGLANFKFVGGWVSLCEFGLSAIDFTILFFNGIDFGLKRLR